jgi:hypothetical protein
MCFVFVRVILLLQEDMVKLPKHLLEMLLLQLLELLLLQDVDELPKQLL